jgi:hypothetical protein
MHMDIAELFSKPDRALCETEPKKELAMQTAERLKETPAGRWANPHLATRL